MYCFARSAYRLWDGRKVMYCSNNSVSYKQILTNILPKCKASNTAIPFKPSILKFPWTKQDAQANWHPLPALMSLQLKLGQ